MEKFQQQLMAYLKGLSLRQRLILGGSAALIAATLWLFVYYFTGPDLKILYSGMAAADAQALMQRLSSQNVQPQLSTDGTSVLVRADQIDRARLASAAQGPIASGRMGLELFDKPNWSGSDFSEKVNYQRALEAELERTIQTMEGVEAVRVHLVLPRESIFTDRERPAKAAVVMKLRGVRLNDQVTASVANLVSSAWDDLSPQNVTVVTTDGQMPGPGHGRTSVASGANQDLETLLAERIVQTLGPVVGPEHVKSSITIDYDSTSGESTQEVYDPNASVVTSSQISQETASDLEPSGIPGTPSNSPSSQGNAAAVAQAKTAGATQGIRSESKTFAVSRTTRHLIEPAGRVKRVAAAILVDDVIETRTEGVKTQESRRKRTPDEMKQIGELAKAAIGFDSNRGDILSVQNIGFQLPPPELPAPAGKIEKVRLFTERWPGLIRYASLFALFALIYFVILRPLKNQFTSALQAAPVSDKALAAAASSGGASSQPGAMANNALGELAEATQRSIALKQQIAAKVSEDPEGNSRLIQSWLGQGADTR